MVASVYCRCTRAIIRHNPHRLCGKANNGGGSRRFDAFVAVARAGGFRDARARSGSSASGLSEAVRRLEAQLGVRLLNRTTRSVVPTEAGARLLERLGPALTEVEAALDVVNGFRDRPAGTLRLNVPVSRGAARAAGDRAAVPRRLSRTSRWR